MNYYETLEKIHKHTKPRVYFEIGVRNGESFQYVYRDTLCVGIDPNYEMKFPYNNNSLLFKCESDKFFEENDVYKITNSQDIDIAFIDGMHLFENVLRDFINIERFTNKNSVVILHDCIPRDKKTSSRKRKTDYWTGDVWKIINILREYRPDLNITLLDSAPSGLALVTNLNKNNKLLQDCYKEIYDKYVDMNLSANCIPMTPIPSEDFNFSALNIYTKTSVTRYLKRAFYRRPKCLGVLLCYNDSDILERAILNLLSNNHDLIVWDHGSSDNTKEILDKYERNFVERKFVPRMFDFYNLYGAMSQNIINNYVGEYDWISWPDQDEILEGYTREKTFYECLREVYRSESNWIRFNNMNYWLTSQDDEEIEDPVKRIKYYSVFPDCAPRIRSWRASVTNIREFNHNSLEGKEFPKLFNLRHYPMRSKQQLIRRLDSDRAGLRRGNRNIHYENMKKHREKLEIRPEDLNYDNGEELSLEPRIDWWKIYGD